MLSLRQKNNLLRLLLSTIVAVTTASIAEETLTLQVRSSFLKWTQFHGKSYDSHEEKMRRLEIWIGNDEKIKAHNAQIPTPTHTLGHNAFSDMTEEEFTQHFKLGKYSPVTDFMAAKYAEKTLQGDSKEYAETARRALQEQLTLPDYVNWVQSGAVTPIKNQGACGACWAFSTTGALEGARFLKTGELVSLSEQNLLDCDHVDLGCSGGLMDNAFKFDEKSGGLCSEQDYPYIARRNPTCMTNCTDVPGSIVQTFVDVPAGDEKALVAAIAMQPVSIAIEASTFAFQFYKTGVITDDNCGSRGTIDHGVLAVGYGTDLDTQSPYYLVKNSWGDTWGDNGFVKIGRGGANEFGVCSILKLASFPVVE